MRWETILGVLGRVTFAGLAGSREHYCFCL